MGSKPQTGEIPATARPRSGKAGPRRSPPPATNRLAISARKQSELHEFSRESVNPGQGTDKLFFFFVPLIGAFDWKEGHGKKKKQKNGTAAEAEERRI